MEKMTFSRKTGATRHIISPILKESQIIKLSFVDNNDSFANATLTLSQEVVGSDPMHVLRCFRKICFLTIPPDWLQLVVELLCGGIPGDFEEGLKVVLGLTVKMS